MDLSLCVSFVGDPRKGYNPAVVRWPREPIQGISVKFSAPNCPDDYLEARRIAKEKLLEVCSDLVILRELHEFMPLSDFLVEPSFGIQFDEPGNFSGVFFYPLANRCEQPISLSGVNAGRTPSAEEIFFPRKFDHKRGIKPC